jgi:hypothetical protein
MDEMRLSHLGNDVTLAFANHDIPEGCIELHHSNVAVPEGGCDCE